VSPAAVSVDADFVYTAWNLPLSIQTQLYRSTGYVATVVMCQTRQTRTGFGHARTGLTSSAPHTQATSMYFLNTFTGHQYTRIRLEAEDALLHGRGIMALAWPV
jgi:hypothetical protein